MLLKANFTPWFVLRLPNFRPFEKKDAHKSPAVHLTTKVFDRILNHLQWLVSKHFQNIGQGHLET